MKDTCLILNSLLLYFQISSPFFSTLVCVLAQEFQLREKGTGAERIRNDSIYFLAFCKFPLIATVSFQRSNFFFVLLALSGLSLGFDFLVLVNENSFPWSLGLSELWISQNLLWNFIMLTTSLLMISLINYTSIFQFGKYIFFGRSWSWIGRSWF